VSVAVALVSVVAVTLALQLPSRAGPESPPSRQTASVKPELARSTSVATLPYTTFVRVRAGEVNTLDPHWGYYTQDSEVTMQVYEGLVTFEREKHDSFVGLLATRWEMSEDGREYTFWIRPGVTFHNGGTLTAEDVAYSFWRGMLQDRENGPMWYILEPLVGVTDIDDVPGIDADKCGAVKNAVSYDSLAGTVTFRLPEPYGAFLSVLATPPASVLDKEWMIAQNDWDADCTTWRGFHNPPAAGSVLYDQMNGTGPFRLGYWTADEIELLRNDTTG
jgi:peptide/nickel transport system substrate-binding protein